VTIEKKPVRPQSKRLRVGRVPLPHQVYSVTLVTNLRACIFAQQHCSVVAAKYLYDADIVRHVDTLAFVVMPDHVHWLLQLKESGDLSEVVRLYKAKVSVRLGVRCWQPGFHDQAVREDEDVASVARYIVANPLRARLCQKIGEYPYWNAIWL
jgi:REP element-mobilizing transposase RayT